MEYTTASSSVAVRLFGFESRVVCTHLSNHNSSKKDPTFSSFSSRACAISRSERPRRRRRRRARRRRARANETNETKFIPSIPRIPRARASPPTAGTPTGEPNKGCDPRERRASPSEDEQQSNQINKPRETRPSNASRETRDETRDV